MQDNTGLQSRVFAQRDASISLGGNAESDVNAARQPMRFGQRHAVQPQPPGTVTDKQLTK
jgi:hypothetical protein